MLFFDEIIGPPEISHGFRSVFRATQPPPNRRDAFSGGFRLPVPPHSKQVPIPARDAEGARFRLKSKPDAQSPDILTKIAAYPPEAQRIIRAFQKYGVIHNNAGFVDFGIEGAYDPRFDDPPDGAAYNDGSGRGVGQGLLVDLRFGVPGRPDTII